jgi:hypothetical protein
MARPACGGGISPAAQVYTGSWTLSQSAEVKARALNAGTWSALTEATFYVIQNFTELLITEIMYHPPATTNLDGDEFEFIELKNVASTNLELSGLRFTDGISFTFPVGAFLAPGQFVVLVSNPPRSPTNILACAWKGSIRTGCPTAARRLPSIT